MFLRPRVIPCLLLKGNGLVKTVKFKEPRYIGDPINAVRIFNEKAVDELALIDIMATKERRGPNMEVLSRITAEAFMPLSYGGGITRIEEIHSLFALGFEKVILCTSAVNKPELIKQACERFGSQSIMVCIDVKKNLFGQYRTYVNGGEASTGVDPVTLAQKMAQLGAGEIFLNSIDKDGTMNGYDIDLIKSVAVAVNVPVIACGGAKTVQDLALALREGKADAVSAGSMFVYYGKHNAVLINVPDEEQLLGAGVYSK